MKSLPFSLVVLLLALVPAVTARAAAYSPDQLDQLLGPVALYPDPLIALILPASTVPADVTLAAAYLAANGPVAGFDGQPWDPSVKALAHYPDVVKWLNDNLAWTETLGAAFAQQPADVMKSIQQLRAEARAAGTLVDTPQQRVDLEGDDIRIVPAQENAIYMPEYDPTVVYETPVGYAGPFVTFGDGFAVGGWLGYQLDWDNYGVWVGPWNPGWGYRREWRQGGNDGNRWHNWRPDPRRSRATVKNYYHPEARVPSPGLTRGYHGPVRRAVETPRAAPARPVAGPDYRGRSAAGPRPGGRAPASPLFGGYSRGTQVRTYSGRGQNSRAAPVRQAAPAHAPAPGRAAPPRAAPAPNREKH